MKNVKEAKEKITDPTDLHVGMRIRLRRSILNMSQSKLADGLGITFQQIQKYEKGINRVGASRLQNIANILKVSPGYFFDGFDESQQRPENSGGDVAKFLATREAFELNRSFSAIRDVRTRKLVLDFILGLAGRASSR